MVWTVPAAAGAAVSFAHDVARTASRAMLSNNARHFLNEILIVLSISFGAPFNSRAVDTS